MPSYRCLTSATQNRVNPILHVSEMTPISIDLTPEEIHAVSWALALTRAVAARASEAGRNELAGHVRQIPALSEVKVSLEAGILLQEDVHAIASALKAVRRLYTSMPDEIQAALNPPPEQDMESAMRKFTDVTGK